MDKKEKMSNLEELFKQKNPENIYEFFYEKKEIEEIINMNERFEAERIIIDSGDTRIMRLWAMYIRSGSTAKMEDATIATKDAEAMFYFAQYVDGSNKHKLRKAIMATKDKFWIEQWKACFGMKGLFF